MKWWISLFLLLTINSCLPGKLGKDDPQPDLAGSYQITSLVDNNTTLIPRSGVSGVVNVTKIRDSQISVSLTLNKNGQVANSALGTVTISKSSGSAYDLIDGGIRIGSIDGTTFTLNYADNTGSLLLTAKK